MEKPSIVIPHAIAVWQRKVGPEALSLELRKRAELWIRWESANCDIFLSDLLDLDHKTFFQFRSDMKVLYNSICKEIEDLKTAFNGLGQYQAIAAQDLNIRIFRAKRKAQTVHRFLYEIKDIQRLKDLEPAEPKEPKKKKAKAKQTTKERDYQRLAGYRPSFRARRVLALFQQLLDESTIREVEVLADVLALEDLQTWATENNLDEEAVSNYIASHQKIADEGIDSLECDVGWLKAKYGVPN
jgi:hypothetical protein